MFRPGLINLHAIANLDLQVLRMDASNESTFPKPKSFVMDASQPYLLTDEQYQTSADFSVATLLKNGSTTFLNVTSSAAKRWEDSSETYALAEASERMGIRAWIGHFYQEGCNYTDGGGESHIVWDSKKGQQAMDHAIEVVKHLQKKNHPLLTGFSLSRADRRVLRRHVEGDGTAGEAAGRRPHPLPLLGVSP